MADEFNPCPYCGGPLRFGYFATTPNVDCPKCQYEMEPLNGETEAEFFARVNTRPAPRVKPLVWEDFEGQGAKAKAIGRMGYLITKTSRGWFAACESYPFYEGKSIGTENYPTLSGAKSAVQAHHDHLARSLFEDQPDDQ